MNIKYLKFIERSVIFKYGWRRVQAKKLIINSMLILTPIVGQCQVDFNKRSYVGFSSEGPDNTFFFTVNLVPTHSKGPDDF